ncbi:MAG: flavin reductase [Rhodospirillales bacterium]
MPDTFTYTWPNGCLTKNKDWQPLAGAEGLLFRDMPEAPQQLARDSRWPALFPSPLSLVTTRDGDRIGLEKVVGASIVNRFPYIIALSFARKDLSPRHHARRNFCRMLESGRDAVVQFLEPGPDLNKVMEVIGSIDEAETASRIAKTGFAHRKGAMVSAPVFEAAYLAYEARLAQPARTFEGEPVLEQSWVDVGSHRIYFLEVKAIQLRDDIAEGRSQIKWKSMPDYEEPNRRTIQAGDLNRGGKYIKGYTPDYRFPAPGTIAFDRHSQANGMSVHLLGDRAADQVQVDNDKARWPCFFPSPVGMVTCWADDGEPNLMPCGSTTVVSRQPFVITPCISASAINQRYAPRASTDFIRARGRFNVGVPFIDSAVTAAVQYAGNFSFRDDPEKVARTGLAVSPASAGAPILSDLPITFECRLVGEVPMGTHIMMLGEVERIVAHASLGQTGHLRWNPFSVIEAVG